MAVLCKTSILTAKLDRTVFKSTRKDLSYNLNAQMLARSLATFELTRKAQASNISLTAGINLLPNIP